MRIGHKPTCGRDYQADGGASSKAVRWSMPGMSKDQQGGQGSGVQSLMGNLTDGGGQKGGEGS